MGVRVDVVDGARSFLVTGQAYDGFMGRYSGPLAVAFADATGVVRGGSALDVGCGPGALTGVLVDRLGAGRVSAMDPSPPFVAECSARHQGVTVRQGRAEDLPFRDAGFDYVLAQLVLHLVSDPRRSLEQFRRVLRPGGVAAACVWDPGMQMLRLFWEAAARFDPRAPEAARTLRRWRPGQMPRLLSSVGFCDVVETTLEVSATYAGFEDLWSGFLAGIGPAGSYCVGLARQQRAAVRDELFRRLGSPPGSFRLSARARYASGRADPKGRNSAAGTTRP